MMPPQNGRALGKDESSPQLGSSATKKSGLKGLALVFFLIQTAKDMIYKPKHSNFIGSWPIVIQPVVYRSVTYMF